MGKNRPIVEARRRRATGRALHVGAAALAALLLLCAGRVHGEQFGGFGMTLQQSSDNNRTPPFGVLLVVSVMAGGPADRAGIRPGDIVTHVNREPVVGQPQQRSVERMRGEVGTFGDLTVQQAADGRVAVHRLRRELVTYPFPKTVPREP